ncbi:hypothetical protein E4U54_002785 [Claviceps lovelessii]|nr:hypothetical protein E4U54_002785 [Claviceps lovelessii]
MAAVIPPPDPARLLGPILPVLPVAAACAQPAAQVLPLLSPILRQRAQLLSSSDPDAEPWLRLLCYDAAKAVRLAAIARGPALEPHPVSGEVEVDWDYDAETRYRRLDPETLQALVALSELGLAFQLVYCVHDKEGDAGGSGWRIGEVTVAEKPLPFSQFGGASTIAEAERLYRDRDASVRTKGGSGAQQQHDGDLDCNSNNDDDDDDDDDYWNLYDKSPATSRSPAPAPRPTAMQRSESSQPQADPPSSSSFSSSATAAVAQKEEEDAYFAQYANVQPAMDNHDPDEQAHAEQVLDLPASMAASQPNPLTPNLNLNSESKSKPESPSASAPLKQPHPDSISSSPSSDTVARLEHCAGQQSQNEYGVKQHIARTIRSLYMLATASGIPTDDFSSLVRTELDCLSMMDDSGGFDAVTNGMKG